MHEIEGLSILYQDDSLIVIDKLAGLLSVLGCGIDRQDSVASRSELPAPKGAGSSHKITESVYNESYKPSYCFNF